MKKGVFYLNDSPSYEGWHDPDNRWNGFACPEFEEAVAVKILEDQAESYKAGGYPAVWKWIDKDTLFFDGNPEDPDHQYQVTWKRLDNGRFDIGAWSWVWTEEHDFD